MCGLVTNRFHSRMDLYRGLLHYMYREAIRGHNLGYELICKIIDDTRKMGFKTCNLSLTILLL